MYEKIKKGQEKVLEGHAQNLLNSIETVASYDEVSQMFKQVSALVLANLEGSGFTLKDAGAVCQRVQELSKEKRDDGQLYSAFIDLVMEYTWGMVSGFTQNRTISDIKPKLTE